MGTLLSRDKGRTTSKVRPWRQIVKAKKDEILELPVTEREIPTLEQSEHVGLCDNSNLKKFLPSANIDIDILADGKLFQVEKCGSPRQLAGAFALLPAETVLPIWPSLPIPKAKVPGKPANGGGPIHNRKPRSTRVLPQAPSPSRCLPPT
jgi:hypothetical protein